MSSMWCPQVAEQQGKYLARTFNALAKDPNAKIEPFSYKHLGSMASIGNTTKSYVNVSDVLLFCLQYMRHMLLLGASTARHPNSFFDLVCGDCLRRLMLPLLISFLPAFLPSFILSVVSSVLPFVFLTLSMPWNSLLQPHRRHCQPLHPWTSTRSVCLSSVDARGTFMQLATLTVDANIPVAALVAARHVHLP